MAGTGRPGKPPGLPKTGGRKVGSLDKAKRQIITDEIAGDILTVYRKMGGVAWLFEWASQPGNGGAFIQQCLARLMPAFPKDGADVQVNTQVNLGDTTEFEAARRIAYALSKGLQASELDPPMVTPQGACRVPEPVPNRYTPPAIEPVPSASGGPEYEAWAEGLSLTDEQRRDRDCAAAPYHGSSAEQGLVRRKKL